MIHTVTEGNGMPLANCTTAANGSEREQIIPLLDSVTLNIKIERKYRQHWMGQAKLQGLTIKDVIVSHLTEKFGLPE